MPELLGGLGPGEGAQPVSPEHLRAPLAGGIDVGVDDPDAACVAPERELVEAEAAPGTPQAEDRLRTALRARPQAKETEARILLGPLDDRPAEAVGGTLRIPELGDERGRTLETLHRGVEDRVDVHRPVEGGSVARGDARLELRDELLERRVVPAARLLEAVLELLRLLLLGVGALQVALLQRCVPRRAGPHPVEQPFVDDGVDQSGGELQGGLRALEPAGGELVLLPVVEGRAGVGRVEAKTGHGEVSLRVHRLERGATLERCDGVARARRRIAVRPGEKPGERPARGPVPGCAGHELAVRRLRFHHVTGRLETLRLGQALGERA